MAIKERVFYVKSLDGKFIPPPRPLVTSVKDSLKTYYVNIKRLSFPRSPYTDQEFVQSYEPHKRRAYSKALEDNKLFGFHSKLAHVKAFGKCEKYQFTESKTPVPRLIQPRDARYLVETGKYIKPIEKGVYRDINEIFGYNVVFKGLNAIVQAKIAHEFWTEFDNPVAVAMDYSRFDQHVSKEMLEFEHSVYRCYYPGDKWFAYLLSLQLHNRCSAQVPDGKFKYHVEGKRMSGDSNTALGNVVLVTAMFFEYIKKIGVKCRLICNGDDSVLILEKRFLNRLDNLVDYMTSFGFTLKLEPPVYEFEHISFCQTRPVFDGTEWVMVRDPNVAIAKDCVAIKPLDNESVFRMWCCAVGKGGMSLTGGIPVWQNFYNVFIRASKGAKPLRDPTLISGKYYLGVGMKRELTEPTTAARVSFYKAFGITPYQQVLLEQYYDTVEMESRMTSLRSMPLPFPL